MSPKVKLHENVSSNNIQKLNISSKQLTIKLNCQKIIIAADMQYYSYIDLSYIGGGNIYRTIDNIHPLFNIL